MSYSRKLLIPLFILTAVISSQLDKEFWPLIGRVLGWCATLAAINIFGKRFSWNAFSIIFIIVLLLFKVNQILAPNIIFDFGYILLQAVLLSVCGMILFKENYAYIHRQLYRLAIANVVVMIVQITGVSLVIFSNDISQFLATHEWEGRLGFSLFSSLTDFNVLQSRPAGITYSNQYLCLLIIAISTIHFANPYNNFRKSSWLISLLIVLSMAKVVFVSFFVLAVILLLFGKSYQRHKILSGIVWFAIFLCFYMVLFPGLYEINLSLGIISYSITSRLGVLFYSIVQQHDIGWSVIEYINNYFPYDPRLGTGFKWIIDLSIENTGYIVIVKNIKYLSIIFFMLLPLYIYKCKKMISRGSQQIVIFSIALTIGMIIMSSAGALWINPFTLIMLGATIYPLFDYTLKPYAARKIVA